MTSTKLESIVSQGDKPSVDADAQGEPSKMPKTQAGGGPHQSSQVQPGDYSSSSICKIGVFGIHGLELELPCGPGVRQVNLDMKFTTHGDNEAASGLDLTCVVDRVLFLLASLPVAKIGLREACNLIAKYWLSQGAHSASQQSETPVDIIKVEICATALRQDTEVWPGEDSSSLIMSAERPSDWKPRFERNAWGTVDILGEGPSSSQPEAGIYRLNIERGKGIPLHTHKRMNESEMVLTTGLTCEGHPGAQPAGSVFRWGHLRHGYLQPMEDGSDPALTKNSSVGAILCVDVPGFQPDDEVLDDGVADALPRSGPDSAAFWRALACKQYSSPPLAEEVSSCHLKAWPSKDLRFEFPGLKNGGEDVGSSSCMKCVSIESALPQLCIIANDVQNCVLQCEPSNFKKSHAVLVVVLRWTDAGSPELLLVRHKKRGWELPGGGVDAGEDDATAALRELHEEAGLMLPGGKDSLQPLAQYILSDAQDAKRWGNGDHVKTVFVTHLNGDVTLPQSLLHETDGTRWVAAWNPLALKAGWCSTLEFCSRVRTGGSGSDRFSPLLQDNVFPLVLRLAALSPNVVP